MKKKANFIIIALCFVLSLSTTIAKHKIKTIHVYVALCDNKSQGIVPVSEKLGNGDRPSTNLYWGAFAGVKNFFKTRKDWILLKSIKNPENFILERCLFKHKTKKVYMLADAYRGKEIKRSIHDFLKAAAGQKTTSFIYRKKRLHFAGKSSLLSYVGHDGLMEFDIENPPYQKNNIKREVIILSCLSKINFKKYIQKTGAYPLLWTTNLMSPEAFTLKAALDGWMRNESNEKIRKRAVYAYYKYIKCSKKGANRLFVTGY